jgi:hypothetical protein
VHIAHVQTNQLKTSLLLLKIQRSRSYRVANSVFSPEKPLNDDKKERLADFRYKSASNWSIEIN